MPRLLKFCHVVVHSQHWCVKSLLQNLDKAETKQPNTPRSFALTINQKMQSVTIKDSDHQAVNQNHIKSFLIKTKYQKYNNYNFRQQDRNLATKYLLLLCLVLYTWLYMYSVLALFSLRLLTIHFTLSLAAQCIVIGPVCNGRSGERCVFVALWVCHHDNSKLCASIFTKLVCR